MHPTASLRATCCMLSSKGGRLTSASVVPGLGLVGALGQQAGVHGCPVRMLCRLQGLPGRGGRVLGSLLWVHLQPHTRSLSSRLQHSHDQDRAAGRQTLGGSVCMLRHLQHLPRHCCHVLRSLLGIHKVPWSPQSIPVAISWLANARIPQQECRRSRSSAFT